MQTCKVQQYGNVKHRCVRCCSHVFAVVHNRCLRTQMVRCSSDIEFLGKLHCIRLAFQYLFKDSATWLWFADTGRQMLADLIIYAEKVLNCVIISAVKLMGWMKGCILPIG